MAETTHEGARAAEVRKILDSHFRNTLILDLDEDIPACTADIVQLRGRWVAEALTEASEAIRATCEHKDWRNVGSFEPPRIWPAESCPFCLPDVRVVAEMAAEYRAGAR